MSAVPRKCRWWGHQWKRMAQPDGNSYKGCERCGVSQVEQQLGTTHARTPSTDVVKYGGVPPAATGGDGSRS
jgi:hypothetical protein